MPRCPKHLLVVGSLFAWILGFIIWSKVLKSGSTALGISPQRNCGFPARFLLTIKYFSLLALPQTFTALVGLVCFDAFPDSVQLKGNPRESPFLCVRVATHGHHQKLVKDRLRKNVSTLKSVGIEHFNIEVVTEIKIGLTESKIKEIVVPPGYRTKRGSLHKSRALQYCLENEKLDVDAWIVHLDEETLLTEDSVRGVLNFINDGSCDFGQGTITYANEQMDDRWTNFQHHVCTVADSFRVAQDMGQLRGQLELFHRPLFGWKGSFIVARLGALKEVSFDHGPESALAEDNYFAMMAMASARYKFGFVEGEMHEKSAFTFADHFQQRRRWLSGWMSIVASKKIAWKNKFFFATLLANWLAMPLTLTGGYLARLLSISGHPLGDTIEVCICATFTFHYFLGYMKQFPISSYSWGRLILVLPEVILVSTVATLAEMAVVVAAWFDWWRSSDGGFYVITKEAAIAKKST